MDNPLVLYSGTGDRIVELFDDLDGDGRCDLLISLPYTEIDLVYHHRFRWNGHDFIRLPDAILRQQNPPNGGHFVWETNAPRSRMYTHWYVYGIQGTGAKEFLADLVILTDPATMANRQGKALMRLTPDGADLIRWIQVPSPPKHVARSLGGTSGEGNFGAIPPASGRGYLARIGPRDHYNSRGTRLRDLREILRQDRYRFYLGGGDREDTADDYGFSSKAGRSFFEWARIVGENISVRRLQTLVVYSHPLLRIRREGDRLLVRIVSE